MNPTSSTALPRTQLPGDQFSTCSKMEAGADREEASKMYKIYTSTAFNAWDRFVRLRGGAAKMLSATGTHEESPTIRVMGVSLRKRECTPYCVQFQHTGCWHAEGQV